MIDALTLRGLANKQTKMITMAKPIDCPRKSDHKLKTEDGNPKFRLHANNHGNSETEDINLAT